MEPGAPELALFEAAARAATTRQLLRVLAEGALAPALMGADATHALAWDPLTGLFEGDSFERHEPSRHPAPDAWRVARTAHPAWELESLDAVTRLAWDEGRPHLGAAPSGPRPWTRGGWIAAVPLRSGSGESGLIVLEFRDPAACSPARLARFAETARVAVEARESAADRERRAAHAAGLDELTRSALSPRNIAEVLHVAARLAAECTGSDGAAVWAIGADQVLALRVTHGVSGSRERLGRALHPVARAAIDEARPREACPATDEFLLPAEAAADLAAIVVIPVLAYGHGAGAVGVWRGHGPHRREPWSPADREFLAVLSRVVGLALDQARRFSELRDAERRERDASQYARRRDALAALGELSAKASREGLKPTASIRVFAARLLDLLGEEDPGREFAEVIAREAERLERLLREQRAHAELTPAGMELVELNGIVERALQSAGETLVRRRARVLKRLAAGLPELLLDRDGIARVIQALLAYALDSIAVGGRVRVETRRLTQHVLVELGHDGVHEPGEVLEQLFQPFGGPRGGTGLSVARRIIEEHGGELRIRADGEWTTLVTFTLPIVGNQDRRRTPKDRRNARDRRALAAE